MLATKRINSFLRKVIIVIGVTAAVTTLSAVPAHADYAERHTLTLHDADGLQEYFWIGTADGQLLIPGSVFHKWENPDHSWSGAVSLNGWFTSGIDGFQNPDGRLEIFGRADGGDLDHIWQLDANGASGWSGWASLGGQVQLGFDVTAGRDFGNTAWVQVFGVDNQYHWKYRRNWVWDSNWS